MWVLFVIWLAGGFASIGALNGITMVSETKIDKEVYLVKFLQSWFAFGTIILIMLSEIGENLEKKQ